MSRRHFKRERRENKLAIDSALVEMELDAQEAEKLVVDVLDWHEDQWDIADQWDGTGEFDDVFDPTD